MTPFASALLFAVLLPAAHAQTGACPGAPGAAPYAIQDNGRFLKPVFAGVKVTKDIAYGEAVTDVGAKQTLLLDVFEPEGDTAALRPAILWLHGGSFRPTPLAKNGAVITKAVQTFARHGYVGVNVEYRVQHDEARPLTKTVEDAMKDVMKAVEWVRKHGVEYRIDAGFLALAGQSAGGMLAGSFTSTTNLAGAPRDRAGIFAQALFWGPPRHPNLPELQVKPDPCYPPTVFLGGNADGQAPYTAAWEMARELSAAGVPSRVQVVEEGAHGLAGREDEYVPMAARFLFEMLSKTRPVLPAEYQAEQYTKMLNASFSKSAPGFTGTGYIGLDRESYIEWDYVDAPAAGEYWLAVRYSNPSQELLPYGVRVNGVNQAKAAFPPAAGWATIRVNVALKAGLNTVRLAAGTSPAGLRLDRIDLMTKTAAER
jgi:acetyl esterase/lipase